MGIYLAFLVLLLAHPLYAQEGQQPPQRRAPIAVLDLTPAGVSQPETHTLSDCLSSELFATGLWGASA